MYTFPQILDRSRAHGRKASGNAHKGNTFPICTPSAVERCRTVGGQTLSQHRLMKTSFSAHSLTKNNTGGWPLLCSPRPQLKAAEVWPWKFHLKGRQGEENLNYRAVWPQRLQSYNYGGGWPLHASSMLRICPALQSSTYKTNLYRCIVTLLSPSPVRFCFRR